MLSVVSNQMDQGRGEIPTSNNQHPENNQIRKQNSARVIAPQAVLGRLEFAFARRPMVS
jgi:hypothetical protein